MSDIPKRFVADYYNEDYFKTPEGKKYRNSEGKLHGWSYANKTGDWEGARYIAAAWKEVFGCKNLLDVGAGRGTFIAYAREAGIEAEGFDFSPWAISEGRHPRCKSEWLRLHDATETWPYEDNSFELVLGLDFYEHIYEDDIDFVTGELYRVASKYIFLQIAVTGSGGLQGEDDLGYILRKDEAVPMGLEGCAVAGHVTVKPESWWIDRLDHEDWISRRDMKIHFISLCPPNVLTNWIQNSILVLEKI